MTTEPIAPSQDPEVAKYRHLRPVNTPPDGIEGLGAGDLERGHPALEPELTDVPVDPPERKPTAAEKFRAARAAQAEPVIPEWAASRSALRETATWAARHYGRRAAYRGVRAPVDGLRWGWWALTGASKVLARVSRWAFDVDGHPLMGTVTAESDRAYVRMAEDRSRRQRARMIVLSVLLVLGLVALALIRVLAPWWALPALALAGTAALAVYGKPADRPMLSGASVVKSHVAPRLTSEAITLALGGLGIAALSQAVAKGRTSAFFPKPITRIRTGWLAEIDLPHGVTAVEVAERRTKLASGLRRPLGSVWPEGDPSADAHEGRMKLYVLDAPLSKLPQPAWPLAKTGRADVFRPLPYGHDPKGDGVKVELMYSNLLVGAIPRQGKTFSVRVIVLGASLDTTVEIHAHELKGTGDLECVEPLAHRYTSGPARDEDLQSVMTSIREVHGYLEPRALTISRLPADRCPEKKVTRELSNDRDLGLHPVLLTIDECQELFESDYGPEAEQLLKAIIKRGPALGIMLVLATQKPNKEALPTSISSNMGLRLCLRVGDQVANDMILGTSAYKMGLNATLFTDADKGVGLLRDGGASARTVRSSYIDGPSAVRIGRRALALRTADGRLSGDAAGQRAETDADRLAVVADALSVWPRLPSADDSAWLSELEVELAEELPERYGNLEAPWLGARLRALGIPVADQRGRRIEGRVVNRAGVAQRDLRRALEGPNG